MPTDRRHPLSCFGPKQDTSSANPLDTLPTRWVAAHLVDGDWTFGGDSIGLPTLGFQAEEQVHLRARPGNLHGKFSGVTTDFPATRTSSFLKRMLTMTSLDLGCPVRTFPTSIQTRSGIECEVRYWRVGQWRPGIRVWEATMSMECTNAQLSLCDDERSKLLSWAERSPTERLGLRARIVLACAEGLSNRGVAGR